MSVRHMSLLFLPYALSNWLDQFDTSNHRRSYLIININLKILKYNSLFINCRVNNCVGENNQKYFVLFTVIIPISGLHSMGNVSNHKNQCFNSFQFYIAVISAHAMFLAINQFAQCIKTEWKGCSYFSPPTTVILLLFLTFEALLFAVFTMIMLGTQLNAIWNDETVTKTTNTLNANTSAMY